MCAFQPKLHRAPSSAGNGNGTLTRCSSSPTEPGGDSFESHSSRHSCSSRLEDLCLAASHLSQLEEAQEAKQAAMETPKLAFERALQMLSILLSGMASEALQTSALHELLRLCSLSKETAAVLGHHDCLYELLRLQEQGCPVHAQLAAAILYHYAVDGFGAFLRLQRLHNALCRSFDLKSGLGHLPCSGCLAPLIMLLRCIAPTAFHFKSSMADSEGASLALAAMIRLLNRAVCVSERAADFFVQNLTAQPQRACCASFSSTSPDAPLPVRVPVLSDL
ncbi:hypothetical protein WJX84_011940 [Apatococcus fuscideae]|uniref:Uncharacterized protein n=1 Tax=Apatococcus fuscideae TaxID=2026836 RepID=A0AAW1T1R8_9CHLO